MGLWAVSAVFANYFQGWTDLVRPIIDNDICLHLYYDLNNSNDFIGIYYFNNHVNMHGVEI
jgi:hypothetical protein